MTVFGGSLPSNKMERLTLTEWPLRQGRISNQESVWKIQTLSSPLITGTGIICFSIFRQAHKHAWHCSCHTHNATALRQLSHHATQTKHGMMHEYDAQRSSSAYQPGKPPQDAPGKVRHNTQRQVLLSSATGSSGRPDAAVADAGLNSAAAALGLERILALMPARAVRWRALGSHAGG